MGYRDLENFNLALLAKQGWQLIQNPNSMMARLLKEKYYLDESFIEVGLGNKPSYVWRSVWNAKKLIREGMMWWVDDGSSIKIWKKQWVPMPSTYSIQSLVRLLNLDATVNQFIDEATRWWNIPLVQEVVTRDEAKMVYSIPICPSHQQDRRLWIGTKNAEFSVNSAYHLAKATSEAKQGSCSDYTLRSKQWDAI